MDDLTSLFAAGAPADPDAPFLEVPDGPTWSWRELHGTAGRIAAKLAALGLEPGSRIVVQVDKSPESLALYLGALRAGLVYVPLNTAYRQEVEGFVADAQPAAVVCVPARAAEIGPLVGTAAGCRHVLTLDAAGGGTLLEGTASLPVPPPVGRSANDVAAILYTSGTTGRSKGAMLTHGNLVANALALDELWGFRAARLAGRRDVLVHALPLFHVHGLFVACHAALAAGARLIFLPRFLAARVALQLRRATVFMGVPTHYTRLLAEPAFTREACSSLRLLASGSAPLGAETFAAVEARTGHRVVERYGMTETLILTSNPYAGDPRARLPGTVGRPLPGMAVRIVDEAGAACPDGVTGHVQVRGPSVFTGYWRLPDRTAEAFTPDGWFRTGDLGRLHDGVLTLAGRSSDLVISGGYNVYPREVEGYLDALAGVAESAVFGLPHPDLGEAVAAAVVPGAGAVVDPAALGAALRERIAGYKVPRRIFLVEELPRNAMGKVLKGTLRARYRDAFTAAG